MLYNACCFAGRRLWERSTGIHRNQVDNMINRRKKKCFSGQAFWQAFFLTETISKDKVEHNKISTKNILLFTRPGGAWTPAPTQGTVTAPFPSPCSYTEPSPCPWFKPLPTPFSGIELLNREKKQIKQNTVWSLYIVLKVIEQIRAFLIQILIKI